MNYIQYHDYLYHHGILGMEWGKRNGPPYPLGVGDHSAKEKRHMFGIKTSNEKPGSSFGQKHKNSIDDTNQNGNKQSTNEKSSSFDYKRAAKIGTAAVAAGLVAYGAYKLRPALTDTRTWEFVSGGVNIPRISNSEIIGTKEDFMKMNPGVIKMPLSGNFQALKGSGTNCGMATTCWDLRNRGFDVQPKELTEGFTVEEMAAFWKGDRPFERLGANIVDFDLQNDGFHSASNITSLSQIKENMKESERLAAPFAEKLSSRMVEKYPEGSRGNIFVGWNVGGAHSMAWEIKNGGFHIRDAQVHDYDRDLVKLFKRANLSSVQILRTDDLEPNMADLSKYIRTSTNTSHMLKNSPKAAVRIGTRTIEGQLAALGGYKLYEHHTNTELINSYKKEHPKTKMTDAQILQSVNKKKK